MLRPDTVTVVLPCVSTLPGVKLLIDTEHVLLAIVTQLFVAGGANAAPAVLFTRLKLTVSPAPTPTQPPPSPRFSSTVAVIWCGAPTALVAVSGLSVIRRSTYTLLALALPPSAMFPAVPDVAESGKPLTVAVAVPWMSTLPGVVVLIWMVHVPAAPVTQLVVPGGTKAAPAVLFSSAKATLAPCTICQVPVASASTRAVIVCASPTRFVAVSGVSVIRRFADGHSLPLM